MCLFSLRGFAIRDKKNEQNIGLSDKMVLPSDLLSNLSMVTDRETAVIEFI